MYSIDFTSEAMRDLEKLDGSVRERILEKIKWFKESFENVIPLSLGGKWRGFFKLRVGDWRIVYNVDLGKNIITIHRIDHRTRVYKRKNKNPASAELPYQSKAR